MPDLTFAELRALGCHSCGGDIDTEGQCWDCGAWISGLEPTDESEDLGEI